MPISDLINQHFTAAEIAAVNNALATIQNTIVAKSRNLTPEERQRFGSIGERNKLFVNKVRDYHSNQPGMSTSDVNWTEFEADYADRNFLEAVLARITVISEISNDTKILHDHDVYYAALMDYDYTKYKLGTDTPGYETKYEDLKQFFSGGGHASAVPENPQE